VRRVAPEEELESVFGRTPVDTVEPLLTRPMRASGGIWRVCTRERSAVLKLLRHGHGTIRWPATEAVDDPWYWRREAHAYEAGIGPLLGSVRMPELVRLAERPDGAVALWLEDVPEPPPWSPERLGEVARRLATAAPAPDDAWLARDWFRSYLALRAPLVAAGGEDGAYLAQDAEAVLARLDALPQVLCHFDFHPGNVRGAAAEVVIDWAYCGAGAPGIDAAVLALDALFDAFAPDELARTVVDAVWAGYAAGLHAAGLPTAEAEWAFLASAALRLSWIPGYLAEGLGTPEQRSRFAALVPLLRELAERARSL
jgi:hypothetical protein